MAVFKERTGAKSASRHLKNPFPDLAAFDAVVRLLIMKNPLGCTSYMMRKKNHRPVEKVRECTPRNSCTGILMGSGSVLT
jgi:hypothetical protein